MDIGPVLCFFHQWSDGSCSSRSSCCSSSWFVILFLLRREFSSQLLACANRSKEANHQSLILIRLCFPDLTAFPELTGESLAFRKQRLAAYREVWANIKSDVEVCYQQTTKYTGEIRWLLKTSQPRTEQIERRSLQSFSVSHDSARVSDKYLLQGVLHQSNEVVFNSLLAFVCQAHAAALTTKGSCATGYLNDEEVPLGLVFAGGINSTDHRDTFERLAVFLRQQASYPFKHTAVLGFQRLVYLGNFT